MANLKDIIRSPLGFFSFAIIITLTLTTCSAPGGLGGNEGTIAINFGGGSRAAVTAWPPSSTALPYITHTITLTGAGGTQTHNIPQGQTTLNITAVSGNWDVKVESFINGYLFGSGTTRVNVAAGQSTACSVNMNKSYPNADYYIASNSNEWSEAVDAISNVAGTTPSGDYVIFVTSNISVAGDTTSTFGAFTGNITIIGDYEISLGSAGILLNLSTVGQRVTLIDTDLKGWLSNNINALVIVTGANAVFTMKGSASVFDNVATGAASGVSVGGGGTFIMEDSAKVSGNIATGTNGSGGGVFIAANGIFTMNGGEVSGNTSFGTGGGVYVGDGTFTMNGSASVNNNKGTNGGGVYVGDGIFTMNGGTITDNIAASFGGGVNVSGLNGTFTMNSPAVAGPAGSIRNNSATARTDVDSFVTINGTAIIGTPHANGW